MESHNVNNLLHSIFLLWFKCTTFIWPYITHITAFVKYHYFLLINNSKIRPSSISISKPLLTKHFSTGFCSVVVFYFSEINIPFQQWFLFPFFLLSSVFLVVQTRPMGVAVSNGSHKFPSRYYERKRQRMVGAQTK